jgi:hypothetical protein
MILPKPPPAASTVLNELPIRKAPIAAPPIIIISKGAALMMTSKWPPASMKPPNTIAKTTTTPMIWNIVQPYRRILRCAVYARSSLTSRVAPNGKIVATELMARRARMHAARAAGATPDVLWMAREAPNKHAFA